MSLKKKQHHFRQSIKLSNPIHLLAVGFGSGISPIMPGTIGSLAAIPLWFLFFYLPMSFSLYSITIYWIIIAIAFFFGCYLCNKTSKDTQTHDSGHIVWDEFVGMWITLFFIIPVLSVTWIIIAFIAFRIFDIWKPWPIKWCDNRVGGGFGIMIDDVIAAVFASIVICVLSYIAIF